MDSPMEGIIFVVCGNEDSFHQDGTEFCLRYIIAQGHFLDDPTEEEAQEILDAVEGDILLIISPCRLCRIRGIKGPRGYRSISRG